MEEILLEELISLEGPLPGAKIKRTSSVYGGCIHKAWYIELDDGQEFFAKTGPSVALNMLEFESECLKALCEFASSSLLVIPKPFVVKQLKSNSILLMPWLNLNHGNQLLLGKGLASLHKASSTKDLQQFGWDKNGFIGSAIQKGGWDTNWGKYFVNMRLVPQLKIAQKWGLNKSFYEDLIEQLIPFLNKHEPQPSLVHGDLWSGNSATCKSSKGIIFDPACYWADREVDIAMTRLFGGFSKDFYSGYNSVWKLPACSKNRVDIYNLYHILNHANIFGGSYINQCLSLIKSISIEILN